MKRRSLLIVVALLCMASLMAAMAYSSAIVTSSADVTVTNTANSLLRFDTVQCSSETGYTVFEEDGMMKFDFTQGTRRKGDSGFGFQPNSKYVYEKLFRIANEQNRDNGRQSIIKIAAETDCDYLSLYDNAGNALIINGVTQGYQGVKGHYTIEFNIPKDAPKHWQPINQTITFMSETVDKIAVSQ